MTEKLLVGSRKGLLVFVHKDGQWRQQAHYFPGTQVSAMVVDGQSWIVALKHGHFGPQIQLSEDGGLHWQERMAPSFTEDTPDKPTVEQIWSLAAGADGTLWAGCITAGLFYSKNQGKNWRLCSGLWQRPERSKWFGGGYDHAGIHSILIDPRDSRCIVIGISCGGIWRSQDGGEQWQNCSNGMWAAYTPPETAHDPDIQDPHRIAQCQSEPDTFWCQHHNGLFVSRDNLASWQECWPELPMSNFGFAIAAHPQDPWCAWMVPAEMDERRIPLDGDFYLMRTQDGGATFNKYNKGLPSMPAYHLVYRHALISDSKGLRLAMASTTGSLWLSEQAGEVWTRISAELPPVYSLAFA